MSPTTNATLADILLPNGESLTPRLTAGLESGDPAGPIRGALAKLAGFHPGALVDGLAQALPRLLDVPITDVLARAWSKSREIRHALERTERSANDTVLVPLLEHTITSEHRPYVELFQGEVPIARLTFPVAVALKLEGVVLLVRRGRIERITAGTMTVQGTVKVEDFVLLEQKSPPLPIPGAVSFEVEPLTEPIREPILVL